MTKRRVKRPDLTTPDLVILSLLDERPRHGYEVNAELERRQVRDWAAVSRPQIYYALEREDWTTGRDRPPFLTWMALSWRAKPGVFEAHVKRRRAFLTRELARERATLR